MTVMAASSLSMSQLADVFNQAFSDYMVEVFFTPGSLREYVYRHSLDLELSLAAEADGYLVGMLMCGSDGETTWNAGMGVHPRWRRRGLGSVLLDDWLEEARQRGERRALLEVIVQNLVALNLYRSRGFRELRAYQGFEGRPTWRRGPAINPDRIGEVRPEELAPVYRKGHSWQKRPEVMARLEGFTALTIRGSDHGGVDGYLIYENNSGQMYIFDLTPNAGGRALLEHAVGTEEPRLLRVVNTIDLVEEDFYRRLGFRPWIRNEEMVVRL